MKTILIAISTLALLGCAKDINGHYVYMGPSVTVGGTYNGIGATVTIVNPNPTPAPTPVGTPAPAVVIAK